jgi:hypothetical protein
LGVAGIVMAVAMPLGAHAAVNNGKVPIKVGPVARVDAQDIGSCNNVWDLFSYNKFFTLTLNKDDTYNLQINNKDGTFVTLDGKSPGACESGVDNGNVVAAGVTGKTHQEYNATVTATTLPNRNPDCGVNNVKCLTAGSFLTAVFGSTWTYSSGFSWTGHYEAGSNGTWFDTSVNWPLNDRGDITGY